MSYLPQPPRVWSRVQSACTFLNPNDDYTTGTSVFTGQPISYAQGLYQLQLLNKGNVLQHKANSSRLTKKQRYTQLAKCAGPNRTKVFATQSDTYSNPNTTGLLRVGGIEIPYPNQLVGQPNNPSGPYQINLSSPLNCPSNVLQDGGNLVCNAIVNPCTQQIVKTYQPTPACFLTTCSDVPGKPINLCWYQNIPTWYPRKRYTMPNSLSKWPEGYKGFVSAVRPASPVLTLSMSVDDTQANLSWTIQVSNCLPISSFNIYQDGVLINNVSYQITSIIISNLVPSETYTFYVESLSTTIASEPSNIVSTTSN
jgi:hypothetical protein